MFLTDIMTKYHFLQRHLTPTRHFLEDICSSSWRRLVVLLRVIRQHGWILIAMILFYKSSLNTTQTQTPQHCAVQ